MKYSSAYHKAYYAKHGERIRERSRAWRRANKDKSRAHRKIWYKENLAYRQSYARRWYQENKDKILRAQHKRLGLPLPTRPRPKRCEMCGGASGKRRLALDHNHITGKFRGWLCSLCNTGLGALGDDITKAIKKLAKYRATVLAYEAEAI